VTKIALKSWFKNPRIKICILRLPSNLLLAYPAIHQAYCTFSLVRYSSLGNSLGGCTINVLFETDQNAEDSKSEVAAVIPLFVCLIWIKILHFALHPSFKV